ncbi:winged helix DNA-binding domain-containing protein [Allokutzneria oryzae]|uniref:Winged helix DNA-binding domain-containing protein n=1 Tax=Allokutzneria oryzae TaxID=1378989 RepID=A0ABV6A180_9PSEU
MLSLRALNRATLARQHLLRRADLSAEALIEHLVGLQAQAPHAPYFGFWCRLKDFRAAELSQLLTERKVVRIAAMRGTVHLLSARDCLELRPITQVVFDRAVNLPNVDLAALAKAGRDLVEEKPRTNKEIGELLAPLWPDHPPESLSMAIRDSLPLVQVPPRGLWGSSGQTRTTTAEHWLGRPLASAPSVRAMVLRYLNAFGPATVADAQKWSGVMGLREVFAQLDLRTFRDDQGRELFDLPDAPRPPEDTPAPVRLLAPFDNLLLSHADRTRVLSDEHRKIVITQNGLVSGTVLVDGFVRGAWKFDQARDTAAITVRPFVRFTKKVSGAVEAEAHDLLAAAAPTATPTVRFAQAGA